MHAIFVSIGGHGSVLLLITLGSSLRRKNHRVTLIAHAPYRMAASENNLEYFPLSDETEHRKSLKDKAYLSTRYRNVFTSRHSVKWNGLILGHLRELSRDPGTLIISVDRENLWCDLIAQRQFNIPALRVQLDLPVLAQPHAGATTPSTRVLETLRARTALEWQRVSEGQGVGAGPNTLHRLIGTRGRRVRSVALWPRWITGSHDYSGEFDHYFGFIPPPPGVVEEAVHEWCRTHKGFIVFAAGSTGTTWNWQSGFLRESALTCEMLKRPGILLGGDHPIDTRHLPNGFICRRFVPLDGLLSSASAIVHHGGIGTSAAAMRHRVPQVIVPRVFGQASNAEWIRRLGVGAVIAPNRYEASISCAVLTDLLSNQQCQRRLDEVCPRSDLGSQILEIECYLSELLLRHGRG